jgi:LmbE family N-acetylglucosaminyl deacetylase
LTHSVRSPESPAAQLRERLREEITGRRPEVIMTWGPDGGYGHGDHRMVSALVTEVAQSIESDWRPAVYYSAIAEGRMPEGTPFGRWAGTDPDLLTVTYSYSQADLAAASTAAQCHETQFDAEARAGLMPFLDSVVWRGEVPFREAF